MQKKVWTYVGLFPTAQPRMALVWGHYAIIKGIDIKDGL